MIDRAITQMTRSAERLRRQHVAYAEWSRGALVAVVVLIIAGAAFLVSRALTDATTFFYNVDEAVERRDQMRQVYDRDIFHNLFVGGFQKMSG